VAREVRFKDCSNRCRPAFIDNDKVYETSYVLCRHRGIGVIAVRHLVFARNLYHLFEATARPERQALTVLMSSKSIESSE
jgi:hypothetical protein